MKKFKTLTYLFAFIFVIGFSACAEDETINELMDDTTLNVEADGGGHGCDPSSPGCDS